MPDSRGVVVPRNPKHPTPRYLAICLFNVGSHLGVFSWEARFRATGVLFSGDAPPRYDPQY